jgi:hypothetical protein
MQVDEVPSSLAAACPSPIPSAAVPHHEPNEASKPNDNPSSLMYLSTFTHVSLKFDYPIGCPVCYNIDKEESIKA